MRNFTVLCALLISAISYADIIPADLVVTGDGTLDGLFIYTDGDASQSGDFAATEGGATTTSTYDGAGVTAGDNPLEATFTDTGDGFSLNSTATAPDTGGEFFAGFDFVIDLLNNSLTETFQVFFELDFANSVDADGDDAFADSELTLDDLFGELFFSDLLSDTFFGDEVGGVFTSGFGDALSDSGLFSFDLTLAPGEDASLWLDYTLEGGVFDGLGAQSSLSAALTITDVQSDDAPPVTVPEPGTLMLLATGLGLLALRRRRSLTATR